MMTSTASQKTRWTPAAIFFIVLWIGLLWVGRTKMLRDPGTLWHTVVGERILRTGELIRTDPFSFTQQGQAWIAQQWLGECAMAVIHRTAGIDGLVLAAVTLLAGLFAFLADRFIRAGLRWPVATLLLLLVIAASAYHFIPRPHLSTILLMAWLTATLCDIEAGRVSFKKLFLLPPAFVLWTNIHGGALGGIATAFIVLMAWLLRPVNLLRIEADPKRTTSSSVIAVVLSLSFVAVLINPYGPSLPRIWLSLMDSDLLPKIIIEHAPLKLLSPEGLMILALAGVYITLLMASWRNGIRATWFVPLIWLLLAFSRVRHGPLFAVTAAVVIGDMLRMRNEKRMMQETENSSFSTQPTASPILDYRSYRPLLIPVMLVLMALTLQSNGIRCPLIGAGWCRLDAQYWPVEATNALHRHIAEHPDDRRVFNDMRYGGYLIYQAADAAIYIDDRCELHREPGLLRYVEIQKDPQLMKGLAAYHDIHLALVQTRSPMAKFLAESPDWIELHRDSTASLYHRDRSGL